MKIIFHTNEVRKSFTCEISNLMQLLDYCKVHEQGLYVLLVSNEYSYTLYKEGDKKAFPILPEASNSDISKYDILFISEKLEGNVELTATAVLSALGTTAAAATTGQLAAAYAIGVVVSIGLTVALGYAIRALSPNKKIPITEDPSQVSRIYNGVPNITEQGGSVPMVFGECLFGGVRIGLKFEPAPAAYADYITVNSFEEAMSYPSTWIKIA